MTQQDRIRQEMMKRGLLDSPTTQAPKLEAEPIADFEKMSYDEYGIMPTPKKAKPSLETVKKDEGLRAEKLQAFDKKFGLNQPQKAIEPNRAQQLKAFDDKFGMNQPTEQGGAITELTPEMKAVNQGFDIPDKTLGENVAETVQDRAPNVIESIKRQFPEGLTLQSLIEAGTDLTKPLYQTLIDSAITGKQSSPETLLQVGGEAIGAVGDVTTAEIGKAIPDSIKEGAEELGNEILKTEEGQRGLGLLQKGMEHWEGFEKDNPRMAANIKGVFNLEALLGTAGIMNIAKQGGRNLLKKAPGAIADLKSTAGGVRQTLGEMKDAVPTKAPIEKVKAPKLSTAAKRAQELIQPTSKKAVKQARKEGRVITPRTKAQRFLFGDKIDPDKMTKEAMEFVSKEIKDLSDNPDKAIGQRRTKIDDINTKVVEKASGIPATRKTTSGMVDEFAKKTDDAASNFNMKPNSPLVKKQKESFNRLVDSLNTKLDKKGSVADFKDFRNTWDKSFNESIKKLSPDMVTSKSPEIQVKWQTWHDGRDIINDKFFDLGDDAFKGELRKMYLGIESIDRIADNAGLQKSFIERYRPWLISSGASALGIGGIGALAR